MSLERVNYSPVLTTRLAEQGVFEQEPFRLIDVGCSGGIEVYWRALEPLLVAAGFDPLVEECARLASIETNRAIQYYPRWVRWPGYEALCSGVFRDGSTAPHVPGSNQPFHRTSAARALELLAIDQNVHYSQGQSQVTLAVDEVSIDEFVRSECWPDLDFLKVDTDGGDYEVLLSARDSIVTHAVLGFTVEVQFHGMPDDSANTFANIDRFLRGLGYSLFDLDVYRYSRAALPDRFTYDIVAQTPRGQIGFGEALYLRDVCSPDKEVSRRDMSVMKLAKLVCLFEIFGLPDCAAELIVAEQNRFSRIFEVGDALNMLATQWWPNAEGYVALTRAFEERPQSFFHSGSGGYPLSTTPS